MADLADLSLQEASELIRWGSVSPVEVTRACLGRIERLNPRLNAFITVTADRALADARDREAELFRGEWRGPLHGIPIGLKDNIDTRGVRTTAGSALFADRVPDQDAEVTRRLRSAGAVCIGKLNLEEFAFGVESIHSHYGAVRNPWKTGHVAGGSSGGSGAAVAAGLCLGALGTDTSGSIRVPAACCGIVGLQPTGGRTSTRGVIPLCWSMDTVGPMARTVTDIALLLQVIAGYDPDDLTSREAPVPNYLAALREEAIAVRLGVPRAGFYGELDPETSAAVDAALRILQRRGAQVREVDLPAIPDMFTVTFAEAYAVHEPYLKTTPERYQPEIRDRLQTGSRLSAPIYIEARRSMERVRRSVLSVFTSVDLLITPTTPALPATIEKARRRESLIGLPLMVRNTLPFNCYDLPSLSVPCGFSGSGLPIGLQITGPPFGEATVLALAHAYEQLTDWHQRRPVVG